MRRLKFRCEEVAESADWDGAPFRKVTLRGVGDRTDIPRTTSGIDGTVVFRSTDHWQVGGTYYAEFKSAEEVAEGR